MSTAKVIELIAVQFRARSLAAELIWKNEFDGENWLKHFIAF